MRGLVLLLSFAALGLSTPIEGTAQTDWCATAQSISGTATPEISEKKRIEIADLLVKGGDIDDPDYIADGMGTRLHHAAMIGDLETVKYLLDKGADVHVSDSNGGTALLAATFTCREDIVVLLLAHGANPNALDRTIGTPISIAERHGISTILRLF